MSSKGIALVTGAGEPCGIGRAIALRLADDGFDVAVNDISVSEDLQSLVKEIQQRGRASSIHAADVSQDAQVKEMIEAVVQKHGSLDVMVANAGVAGPPGMVIADVTVEEWDRVMNFNARGTFLSYKYAGLQMVKQGRGGRIIGASSLTGKQGHNTQVPYSASKFAVRGLTQSAAIRLAGITVNAYAPGVIETPMSTSTEQHSRIYSKRTRPSKPSGKRSIFKPPRSKVNFKSRVPTDIADFVSFIASKESKFITGQTISINGGLFFD
ncbi:acetoin reductase family protein [Roridomyces roridus]|uniref:Acetoin reductase family protein n=1 Tax=Roridomyces roridus TaxID=1738132 RepID=A0AAD7FI50_9AGAR|nr:acetoin reductase family protein [Roridomyces roridus]